MKSSYDYVRSKDGIEKHRQRFKLYSADISFVVLEKVDSFEKLVLSLFEFNKLIDGLIGSNNDFFRLE